jgi:putative FmdB family regulatory protein
MPIIAYACKCGQVDKKFFRDIKTVPKSIECPSCKGELKRQLSAPTTQSKLVIDNGSQARSVEVNPDVIEIFKERANKDYSED